MAIIERLAAVWRSLENPRVPLTADAWDEAGLLANKSDAGVRVNKETALNLAAVFQAVNLISGDLAKLPMEPYKRLGGSDREADRAHKAYRLVRRKANREMSAFRFWRLMFARALFWGNAYAAIDRSGAGWPLELFPLLPDRTAPERINGRLYYATEIGRGAKATVRWLDAADVFHLQGVALDDMVGLDLIEAAREAFGLGLARQKFAARFFKNGARVSGILQAPPSSTKEQRDKVAKGVEKAHSGLDAAHKVIVLRDNFRFTQTTISPNEGQMIESGRESIKDVARYFNVPPHKLADSTNASHNSLEQENQSYHDSTLSPWLCAAASEADIKLLSAEEQESDSHYFEHNTRALLRTDTKTRFEVYGKAIEYGILSPDEARAAENLNKRPDGKGGEYLRPLNMAPAGELAGEGEGDDDDTGERGELLDAARRVAVDAVARVVKRLTLHARRAAKRPATWPAWLEAVEAEHGDVAGRMLAPAVELLAATTGRRADAAGAIFAAVRRELAAAAGEAIGEELEQRVGAACDGLDETAAAVAAEVFQL